MKNSGATPSHEPPFVEAVMLHDVFCDSSRQVGPVPLRLAR